MRFSLTDDQVALRDAVRDLLATAPAETTWPQLAGMGLFSALVPESAGGLGLSDVDAMPLLMEVGYAAVPHPVAETILAAPLLVGDPRLPDVLAGRLRITIAGRDGLVPFGADLVLVLDEGPRIVAPTSVTARPSVDPFRPLLLPTLPAGGRVEADPTLTRQRVDLAAAAQLVGLGRRMLDLSTAYVSTRHQFGVPVGSFQAVKHHLANALLELDFAAPAVLAAAWALDTRTRQARAVAMAAILATEAASRTARVAIQVHGAIGYTVEYELHRFAKRAWALAATIDIDEHLDRIAEELEL
jgi:alkylation response protein AidB-like acyl-CoA dehydrogenase